MDVTADSYGMREVMVSFAVQWLNNGAEYVEKHAAPERHASAAKAGGGDGHGREPSVSLGDCISAFTQEEVSCFLVVLCCVVLCVVFKSHHCFV